VPRDTEHSNVILLLNAATGRVTAGSHPCDLNRRRGRQSPLFVVYEINFTEFNFTDGSPLHEHSKILMEMKITF